jgi:2-dehydropantoate 2-reductase
MLATGRKAGPFETSMLQDYRAGRPLELDAIANSVLELAGKVGGHMPTTRLLVDLCAHRAARRDNPGAASVLS